MNTINEIIIMENLKIIHGNPPNYFYLYKRKNRVYFNQNGQY